MNILKSFTFFLLLGFGQVHAQGNWKVIYENDADGNSVYGKIEDLKSAIRSGEEIRVYFIMSGAVKSDKFVEHTTEVNYFTIMNSAQGSIVKGQIESIIGQTPSFETNELALKENLSWSLILSTDGKNDHMTINTKTGEVLFHGTGTWGTKWFVRNN